MLPIFGLLAGLKGLRGTALDLLGYTAERRTERRLIAEYEAVLDEFADRLDAENMPAAVELAELPMLIRGFGHVKQAALERVEIRRAELLDGLRNPRDAGKKAA